MTSYDSTATGTDVHAGWHLLAFRSELTTEVTPLAIGDRALVALREDDRVRVLDAACPHRGAHLGHGGRREKDCLVCPFHGRRVALGNAARPLSVAEYPVLLWGDAVFARLTDDPSGDRGFEQAVKNYADDFPLVPAVTLPVAVDSAYVVENAFDADHFKAVHMVPGVRGWTAEPGPSGELVVEGEFLMQTSPWRDERHKEEVRWRAIRTNTVRWDYRPRFLARAYSPGVVVTEFGPEGEIHVIVTGAVPTPGGCTARVAIGVRDDQRGTLPALIAGSRKALAEDQVIWEHLVPGAPERLDGRDAPVVAFRAFRAGFPAAPAPWGGAR